MIIEELEQYRLKMDITNEGLARMLGIHPISLYRIKRTGKFNAKFLLNAQKILSPNAQQQSQDAIPKLHQTRQDGRGRGYFRKSIVIIKQIFAGTFSKCRHFSSPFSFRGRGSGG